MVLVPRRGAAARHDRVGLSGRGVQPVAQGIAVVAHAAHVDGCHPPAVDQRQEHRPVRVVDAVWLVALSRLGQLVSGRDDGDL